MPSVRILRGPSALQAKSAWRSPRSTSEPEETANAPASPVQGRDGFEQRLEEMEAAVAKAREEAYRQGLSEGEARGKAAEQKFEALNRALAEAIAELSTYKAELRASAERDMVELSVAIARRVLRREISVDPHALEGIVAASLDRISAQEITVVKTHPFHAGALRDQIARLAPTAQISVEADPTLAMGSVIFEITRGSLDGSIESQLDEIQRGLADHLGKRR